MKILKKKIIIFLICARSLSVFGAEGVEWQDECAALFRDLSTVEKIDKEIKDTLPIIYNFSMMAGYFNMPSARMAKAGWASFGGGYVPPYQVYGLNYQPFDHIELSANYRVFTGVTEPNFGKEGFGDDAERIGNVKVALHLPEDGYPEIPNIAVGIDDFIGTKRFNSQYIVATKEFTPWNLEVTLGWGRKRIKGLFGGLAWTPFRQTGIPVLKNLTAAIEYDAIDYKKHPPEHPKGREVDSRWNVGLNYVPWDLFQFSVSTVRGKDIAGAGSIRYPIGTTPGLFLKVADPSDYKTPVDHEPLGVVRPEKEFAHELAYGLSDQGLDLYTVTLGYDEKGRKIVWLKVINNRYWQEDVVRRRIQKLLAALIPSDVAKIIVEIEADALLCHSYVFRSEDLVRYRYGLIGEEELQMLSPMREARSIPISTDHERLFERRKRIWTFTARPQILTFFGSAKGKFKYSLGVIASPEGYLFDEVYYKLQLSYSIKSSMINLNDMDKLNPSQIPNVRTDSIKYFQTNTVAVEEAYVQKDWNFGRGWFGRIATGYFEPAYGGAAVEFLYYPVRSNWAVGLEGALVPKRRYHGLWFTHKIRKLKGTTPEYIPFIGVQYFLDLYYDFKPLSLDCKVSLGQFLARDMGVRTEVGRYFKSGLKLSLWCTVTNGHDKVNGKIYYDKGFAFSVPLDIFLRQSSRNRVGYAMAAWLRDVGAQAATGKKLYNTLYQERFNVTF